MKKQIKFKINCIKLDIYKNNTVPIIQFNVNPNQSFEILTVPEILDRLTLICNNHKGILLLDLPINLDYSIEFANKLNTLIIQLQKTGHKIIIKSEFNAKLLQYVFNANLQAEFLVNIEKIQYETILNLTDKITLSFQINSQKELDPIISFIKLIRPHTRAQFNLYVNSHSSFTHADLCSAALQIPNILQLGVTLEK